MLIKSPHDIPSDEITPEKIYLSRRQFMGAAGLFAAGSAVAQPAEKKLPSPPSSPSKTGNELEYLRSHAKSPAGFYTAEKQTPYKHATTYNNFYEFGTGKGDPARYAHEFNPSPWSVRIEGEAQHTGTYTLEDILKPHSLQERIYRLRCVEAWSMVIPWIGFPLGDLLRRFEPNSRAKYVHFTTVHAPKSMRGQRAIFGSIPWPYVEGLRMDEAMHPLTIMVVGMYGKIVPVQNGAPLRLIVPWKYGFKSIKSIVKIRFTEHRPQTTWERSAPREYGFYANVNPQVDHPRWSQASERRLPSSLFSPNRIPTQLFNGYAEQVASLYKGMDLRKFF